MMQILLHDLRQAILIIVFSSMPLAASVSAGCSKMVPAEIRIGSVTDFTDKGSPAAVIARVASAFFAKVNAGGGLNGRPIRLISYDYHGDRRKALDLTRRLREADHVALLFEMDGRINDAIMPYVRFIKIPQMYDAEDGVINAASTALQARTLGEYILKTKPNSRIAILYEDGKSSNALEGFFSGLGAENARAMVTNMLGSAEFNGNRVERVSGSSADFLAIFGGAAFQTESMGEMVGLRWQPIPVITDPAEIMMAVGTISATNYLVPMKLTADEAADWDRFKSNLEPNDSTSKFAIDGYLQALSLFKILKQCDDALSSVCLNQAYMSQEDTRTERSHVGSVIRFDGHLWTEITGTGTTAE